MINLNYLLKTASKITALPVINKISVSANRPPNPKDIAKFLSAQRLARKSVLEISSMMKPGWSEQKTADLINTWLMDNGVGSFFHKAFVWFGERTRFSDVGNYVDFLPGKRVLRENEVFILDVAPIVEGYICDIGYSDCFGENSEFSAARAYLGKLRQDLPSYFIKHSSGGAIWDAIDQDMQDHGYENIHKKYPFSVLGHRIHKSRAQNISANLVNFGWQSYWELMSRGLFGQLLNQNFEGDLTGLWAIEPHLGKGDFGAKFEEILLVEKDGCRWIEDDGIGLLCPS